MERVMVEVILQRAWCDKRATLGILTVVGKEHNPFFTLENPLRETNKDSRIPAGEYVCAPYSGAKFKDVYILKDVPDRTFILIHPGNFESDTEGCILVGKSAGSSVRGPAVFESKYALQDLKAILGKAEFKLKIFDIALAPEVRVA
jgi:hypothetical protein